ncbi:MAG: HD domain-containing protein [Fibrobacter sp.]|nr:HD domain-containing protein [Fibrobacter sp.]
MIELTVNELKAGLSLARSVYRSTGEILLTAGYTLTNEVIEKLKESEQFIFWVQEPGLEHILPEELIPEHLYNQAVEELRLNAEHLKKSININSENFDYREFNVKTFLKSLSNLPDALLASRITKLGHTLSRELRRVQQPFLLHLASTRNRGNYLLQHAVDVTIVAICLGRYLQYSEEELENLAVGTLLMDIGLQALPGDIAVKAQRLSIHEFNALKEHPNLGFEIIRNSTTIPLVCAHVAYQHQERQDGGGYPRRLTGTNTLPLKQKINDKRSIHRYAEIAAVADAFVSLIKPRPGEKIRTPVEAIKFLLLAATTQLNAAIVETLIPMIPILGTGSRVKIIAAPDEKLVGYTAIVSKSNPAYQELPEITLLYDAHNQWTEHVIINLAENPGYALQQISIDS